eukprot:scaffold298121_cov21-Tisochrysis_lutea.AAC.1
MHAPVAGGTWCDSWCGSWAVSAWLCARAGIKRYMQPCWRQRRHAGTQRCLHGRSWAWLCRWVVAVQLVQWVSGSSLREPNDDLSVAAVQLGPTLSFCVNSDWNIHACAWEGLGMAVQASSALICAFHAFVQIESSWSCVHGGGWAWQCSVHGKSWARQYRQAAAAVKALVITMPPSGHVFHRLHAIHEAIKLGWRGAGWDPLSTTWCTLGAQPPALEMGAPNQRCSRWPNKSLRANNMPAIRMRCWGLGHD